MKKKYHLYLTADERRIIMNSLIDMKNELIRTGHFIVDQIFITNADCIVFASFVSEFSNPK